ncbi:hypothetical protein AB3N60_18185 [Leptospira sp. WS39.C2]
MIEIGSFFYDYRMGKFISVDMFSGKLDNDYIHGIITLKVEHVFILQEEYHADDLDFFWPYLLNCMVDIFVDSKSKTEMGFPSQSISLQFETLPVKGQFKVSIDKPKKLSAIGNLKELHKEIILAAGVYYENFFRISPHLKDKMQYELGQLEKLEKVIFA